VGAPGWAVLHCVLECGEQAPAARDGKDHRAQLPEHCLPFLDAHSLHGWVNVVKDFVEAFDTMGRKLDGHRNGVNQPPQHLLPGPPRRVAFQ